MPTTDTSTLTESVRKPFSDLAATSIGIGKATVGDLFSAMITLVICLIAIRVIMRVFTSLLRKSRLDARVQKYLLSGSKLLLYFLMVLIVVDSLGIPVTSLVALLSVGSLGITLAAEDILANVAGGLVILSSHPFSIGDFIEADSVSGTVEEISLNHTKLITPAGQMVMLPNKALSGSKMTNYSVLGRRRVEWKVTASYDAPTEDVKAACRLALERTPDKLSDPAPAVYLTEYGSSSIEYSIYCWCTPENYWPVYFTLGENLRGAFAEKNVEMTYDHLNVHLVEKS